MAQSESLIYVHLVFSTKNRNPLLIDPEFRNEMHAYYGGCLRNIDCIPICIGGFEDHIHALLLQSGDFGIRKIIRETKRASSMWAKTRSDAWSNFYWQRGYGAFSVSYSNVNRVVQYIETQEEHHRKVTFQDEYRALLKRHGIEFDERYIWD